MNSLLTIIFIVVGIILVLLMAQLIVRNRLYKEVQDVKQWKQEIKDKPVADELKKVKDLHMTGQTEELFEKWRHEWDDIIAVAIPEAEEKLQTADTAVSQFSFRKGRQALEEAAGTLRDADDRIHVVLAELQRLLQSYQKNASEIEVLRHSHREIKKNVLAYRHTFSLAEKKLEELLDEQSQAFRAFDEATANGDYLEAREIVQQIESGISYLQRMIHEVPELQAECQTTLPMQLESVLQGYKEMEQQGYVLEHLAVAEEVKEMNQQLCVCLEQVRELHIAEAKEGLESLKLRLDALYDQLEEEVKARHHVEKEVITLHDTLEDIRIGTAETREETQFVKQSYQLSDKDVEMQKYIEKQLSILIKRYDMLQLRIAEQDIAFSVIREEIDEIHQQMAEVRELHIEYKDMLQMLRKEELQAREALTGMRQTIVEAKRLLQKSNVPGLPQDFMRDLQQAQVAMQRVYEQLEFKPLNMTAVNSTLEEALRLVTGIYEETEALIQQVQLVERFIQYGNRYRSHDARVAAELTQAEKLFRAYQYRAALEQAASVLEYVEPGVSRKIEEFMDEE